jgi:hypothetical protein
MPSRRARSEAVGNGANYVAAVTSGTISSAVGSFPSVTGVTGESDGTPNGFSLQLNTNFFHGSPACNGARTPSECQAWQQFIYANTGQVYMQYWLIDYVNTCPSGWMTLDSDCWRNSFFTQADIQPLNNLANLVLTGATSASIDTVTLSTGSDTLFATGQDSVLNLQQGWNVAEFNIVGNGDFRQAVFNSGATIVVKTSVNNGTTASPVCTADGFTGETNNLNLVPSSCCPVGGASPGITFTESNASSVTVPFCLLNDLEPILSPLL